MDYDNLIEKLAKATGLGEKAIRELLNAMPPILMAMDTGESVQTPLGTFTGKHRRSKRVKTLRGGWVDSTPRFVVGLKPGKHMTRDAQSTLFPMPHRQG